MAQSQRLRELLNRLKVLERHFLPKGLKFPATGQYSKHEEDQGRAFVLLVHAELESYFEDRVEEVLSSAATHWRNRAACNKTLKRLLRVHLDKSKPWLPIRPTSDAIQAAISSHKSTVTSNHGIKEENLLKLLFPVGIDHDLFDVAWLATMNTFGAARGGFAHDTQIKATQAIDLQTHYRTVRDNILPELKKLDKRISNLK